MPTLYYVDDERAFLNFVENAIKDKVDYKPYCGAGASDEFFNTLIKKDSNIVTDDSFYLLDGRMSVPTALEKKEEVWRKFEDSEKSVVCGLAMASYLITEHNVDKDKIKIFTAYLGVIGIYAEKFDFDDNIFLDKHGFNAGLLDDWLNGTNNNCKG